MNILFVSSEVAPFSKTGGLADVAFALPDALASMGHNVKVFTPRYGSVKADGMEDTGLRLPLRFPFGQEQLAFDRKRLPSGCEVIFVRHPGAFERSGIYGDKHGDFGDNDRRFALLSLGALSGAQAMGFFPDIVHANDWQTGLVPLALKSGYAGTRMGRARSVFTIHNLAYQGVFPKASMNALGLPWDFFTAQGLEFHDHLCFLKAGLVYSDALTTVSQTYAREIQGREAGHGLEGLLRSRRASLHGIVNGVDTAEWSPETDKFLPARFSVDAMSGKEECKREVFRKFHLQPYGDNERVPLFTFVTRLADQKGIDLLLSVLPGLLEQNVRVAGVGSGEARFENGLRALHQRYPHKFGLKLGYDNALAHLVEAGGDFFLMPSRYEPCGLNQLYSLAYGNVPIVRATGGLEDTVVDLSQPNPTGIKFGDYSAHALFGALERALWLYSERRPLSEVRRRGMSQDFSWRKSAAKYEALYRSLG